MNFLPSTINIKEIKVNGADHLGVFSLDSTMIKNRNVSAKKNQGFGQQMADNTLNAFSITSTFDNELQDSLSQKIYHTKRKKNLGEFYG
ncbi:hypothetical protein ACTHO0_04460 [Cytobacillus praedii]|uniref:hypothetical protein n=1 Tax=Cytobacillus praedii TaxID=1742358 RepID=UPI003F807C5C